MTIPTVTTEAIAGVADLKAGYTLGHADVAILKAIAAELLAVREAQPVADEVYAELYRLRTENKGPDGFETWKDAAIFERGRRMGAERKFGGEEMTYLEAMALLTKEEAQNLSAIEAFRRGASYSGKINAHALRDSMRYQFLRDKDAFGAENEPGLAGWGELIDLDGNEFDAAIDARMAHPDIAYTAPPAPAVPTVPDAITADNAPAIFEIAAQVERIGLSGAYGAYASGWNACRAAMLQPVSQGYTLPEGYKLVPVALTAENGAKASLIGEFTEVKYINCPECFGDDECESCDGSGRIKVEVPVTWTTIKAIWKKGIEHFDSLTAAPTPTK